MGVGEKRKHRLLYKQTTKDIQIYLENITLTWELIPPTCLEQC